MLTLRREMLTPLTEMFTPLTEMLTPLAEMLTPPAEMPALLAEMPAPPTEMLTLPKEMSAPLTEMIVLLEEMTDLLPIEGSKLVRQGKLKQRMASLQAEFLTDILAVLFDSSRTDEKLFTDLFGGQVFPYQF